MKTFSWFAWLFVTVGILSFYGYELFYEQQKPNFLPGAVTHGHFQIEMACDTCHSDAFGGEEVLQDACLNCHEEELKTALDSHPRKKFTDPRNADLLEVLDARYCASCHLEHQNAMVSEMGVSLPTDYCFHCHQEIGDDRESHKDLPYDSCQSSGCHNYHDNRALYEGFIAKHMNEPNHKQTVLTESDFYDENLAKLANMVGFSDTPLASNDANQVVDNQEIMKQWAHSSHAVAGVNCDQCHGSGESYTDTPEPDDCKTCHGFEVDTFFNGKHGMRLAAGLTPMTPEQSALPMHTDLNATAHQELSCNSCHASHEFNTTYAAVDACLSCHNDEHSNNYKQSKHASLREREVTCATCHMPKVEVNESGVKGFKATHNQNDTLRPNEKMIRPVCLDCHGLQFSLNALADKELIMNNFMGMPDVHIKSIDWVEKRNQNKRDSVY